MIKYKINIKKKIQSIGFLILLSSSISAIAQNKELGPALESRIYQNKDSINYPTLIQSSELDEKLNKAFKYPEYGIKHMLDMVNTIKIRIDTFGNVKQILFVEDQTPFDSISIKLLNATSGHWRPAIQEHVKTELDISVALLYTIQRNKINEIYNNVEIFGISKFISDTLKDSPSTLFIESESKTQIIEFKINTPEYPNGRKHRIGIENKGKGRNYFLEKSVICTNLISYPEYGTVTVAFDLDTNGKLSNIELANKYSPKLDEDALKFIKSTESMWLPEIINGIPQKSHVQFDIYYKTCRDNLRIPQVIPNKDRMDARKFLKEKMFSEALKLCEQLCKYYIRDPEVFLMRGMCYLNSKDLKKACEDLKFSILLAEKYGYPKEMNAEITNQFLKKSCGE
jgi:hypothetical protein